MCLFATNIFFTIICFLLVLAVSISATGSYLTQAEAIELNAELIYTYKYTYGQLTELAGLSAASAIKHVYPNRSRVLVICGPGDNGGNGLVCAHYLKSFGYLPDVYCPHPFNQPRLENLTQQCKSQDIKILKSLPIPNVIKMNSEYKLIIDALFGVHFRPKMSTEYKQILTNLQETTTPIASIDVPSGWHLELGPNKNDIRPEFLISIGTPKLCAKFFQGKYHYLGGCPIPSTLLENYNLSLPSYQKDEYFVRLN